MTRFATGMFTIFLGMAILPALGQSEPRHGISMYGDPALEPGFSALPYANPDAPKGGTVIFGETGASNALTGGFDSLNPYILKGSAPWGIQVHVFETLMARNWNEPFALYGLLAETVETGPNREWVEFVLRPEARFSDGSPVTVEDVIWSMETLAAEGHPRYKNAWEKVDKVEKTGDRSVRVSFKKPDAELALLIGLRPILRKADWDNRPFGESSLDVPTGSGPYVIGKFEPGRYITFDRNPDYWGKDLAYNHGLHNFDTIRYDYFVDSSVRFQAFTAGEISFYREGDPGRWATDYNFAAVKSGEIKLEAVPHGRPSGMKGFVFNTRRDIFKDRRVRDALLHAFNFEFINQTLNDGAFPRRTSFFSNSDLGMQDGPAEGRVRDLLEPFRDELAPEAFDGYSLPASDGQMRNRANLRKARSLLEEAGWSVQDGVLKNAGGQPFAFEILLNTSRDEAVSNLYVDALRQLGIEANVRLVDAAQFNELRNDYDYDVIVASWNLSLSPGNEQMFYWGSDGVTAPGTRNYMGLASPAAEAMIEHMLTTRDQSEFVAAVRALDRILTTGRFVTPFWFSRESLIAYDANLRHPEQLPVYGDWIGWMPEVWWHAEN